MLDKPIFDPFGRPIPNSSLRSALLACCLVPIDSDLSLPAADRIGFGDLAYTIVSASNQLELNETDRSLLIARAAKIFASNAMIWGIAKALSPEEPPWQNQETT